MGIYARWILPRLIDRAMQTPSYAGFWVTEAVRRRGDLDAR